MVNQDIGNSLNPKESCAYKDDPQQWTRVYSLCVLLQPYYALIFLVFAGPVHWTKNMTETELNLRQKTR